MKTWIFRALAALLPCGMALLAEEPQIPDQPPLPPELIGRWMEKTAGQDGSRTRYCLYVFSSKSEFVAFYAAFDARSKQWSSAAKIFKGGEMRWNGYAQSGGPGALTLHAMPLSIFPIVLPIKITYKLHGDALTLSKSLNTETLATLKRVKSFPEGIEPEKDRPLLDKKIAEGLFGDEVRQLFLMGMREASEHPSDEALMRTFREHRDDFEKLRAMMGEDKGMQKIEMERTDPENAADAGITPERVEAYRALFRKLGLERGVYGFGDSKEVGFYVSSRGMLNSGSSKQLLWLSEPPAQGVVESIDDYVKNVRTRRGEYFDKNGHAAPNEYFTIYRQIEGDWWLCYRH